MCVFTLADSHFIFVATAIAFFEMLMFPQIEGLGILPLHFLQELIFYRLLSLGSSPALGFMIFCHVPQNVSGLKKILCFGGFVIYRNTYSYLRKRSGGPCLWPDCIHKLDSACISFFSFAFKKPVFDKINHIGHSSSSVFVILVNKHAVT